MQLTTVLAALATAASAKEVMVQVGAPPMMDVFMPNNVTVGKGDTIRFHWVNGMHFVAQSDFNSTPAYRVQPSLTSANVLLASSLQPNARRLGRANPEEHDRRRLDPPHQQLRHPDRLLRRRPALPDGCVPSPLPSPHSVPRS